MKPAAVGAAAKSLNGRDGGRIVLIKRIEGKYAYVADGRLRKVEAPKKKNLCHLRILSEGAITDGASGLTNKQVWKLLAVCRESADEKTDLE